MVKPKKQIVVIKQTKAKRRGASAPQRQRSGKSILKEVASSIGGMMYGPIGARVGSSAAGFISKIMGQGDYKVNKNTLLSDNGPPSFSTNGDDVIIKHREFVSDISSKIAFTNRSYLLNPGNASLFPWLSQIAQSFEEYEFLGLVLEFKSTSGNAIASTNNALGTVILATDYNVENANMTTKRAMETTEFSTSGSSAATIIHPIECDKARNVLPRQYVTTEATVAGVAGDPRFYFLGNAQLATVGQQADSIVIGEFWVSYQVRLSRPIFQTLSLYRSPQNFGWYSHFIEGLGTTGTVAGWSTIAGIAPSKVYGDTGPAVLFFQPNAQFSEEPAFSYVNQPQGIYEVTARYRYTSAGSITVHRNFDYSIVQGSSSNSTLTIAVDDSTTSLVTQSSLLYFFDDLDVTTASTWQALFKCRLIYRPDLYDKTHTETYLILPTFGVTAGTTTAMVCDVTVAWVSDRNSQWDRQVAGGATALSYRSTSSKNEIGCNGLDEPIIINSYSSSSSNSHS